jgi:diguanylate cyclase (GGDEF)-like protein
LAAVSPAGVWEDEEFAGPSGLAPLALPYVAVLPLVGLTLYKIGHGEASMALVAGATASGLLLLARQFFTLVENRRLYRELEREGSLLAHAATHDDLTGALNRRGFDVVLQDTLSRVRGQRSAAVLYIDLDDFKAINDSLGHPAGDAFLVSHGALLNQVVRPGDALARLGGDEFAVLLHDVDEDEAVATAQRLLQALRRHTVELYGRHVKTTASIGIALAPAHGTTVEGLLAHADAAMYEAKERGRNRIAVYDASGSTEILSESRLEWRRSIDEALQYDRFRLYAQPVVDLRTRRVSAYEVLIRMQRDDGELVLPEAFLGIAERFGMIDDIDRWVLAHACAVLSERQAAGLPVLLSVNVSTRTLLHAGLHSFLAEQIQRSGADPRQLIIEITETMAVDDVEGMLRQMNEIRELGIRFALDDFGAGYSSFSHLRRLPVDYLKIDGSFVQRLGSDGNDRAIVGAIAQLAQSLGRETVAEFVEDEATALELERLGIRYGQGYYLGEPAPIEEALQRAAAEQAAA